MGEAANEFVKDTAPVLRELADAIARHHAHTTVAEAMHRALREAIFQGILPEGMLLRERDLAAVLGVSRTPLREALVRLEAEGIVVAVPHGGMVVAEVTPQEVQEIYELRTGIEGMAARLAAQRASQTDIAALEGVLEDTATAIDVANVAALPLLSVRFHRLMYEAARNRRLTTLATNCYEAVQRVRRSSLARPGRAAQTLAEHRRILEAVRRRDPDEAERMAREHLEQALRVRRDLAERG